MGICWLNVVFLHINSIIMKIFLLALCIAGASAIKCFEKDPAYCEKNAFLCKEAGFVDYMKQVCPIHCGYCKPEEAPVEPEIKCFEKDPAYCEKNAFLCKQADFVDYMKQVCPIHCGYCKPEDAVMTKLTSENIIGQECIDMQKTCMSTADNPIQKIQCWVQFGLCMATSASKCIQQCVPPLKECKEAAGRDWLKNFQCAAAYIKCVTTDCH